MQLDIPIKSQVTLWTICMANILRAKVEIKGIRPLLWHHFGPDALPLEKKERTGVAGNDPEEWKKSVLMTDDRRLYLRPNYIFGCLRDGAKHTPRKRGTLQPYVAATLQIANSLIFIERDGEVLKVPEEPVPTDPTLPVFIDIQSVKNPATRARNVRYRIAASSGWEAHFTLEWDATIVSRNEMNAVCLDSGRFCGLGDGRSIGYGRFEVIQFQVEELNQSKAVAECGEVMAR
jgi:hypothetical protein